MNRLSRVLRRLDPRKLVPQALRRPGRPKNNAERDALTLNLFGFVRAILLATVAMTVAVPSITWYVVTQRDDTEAREDQKALDGQYLNCLRGNEFRDASILAEEQPGQVLDLTPTLDGSEPDWFARYVARLKMLSEAAMAAPIDPRSKSGQAIAVFTAQIRDCEAEYPDHTPGIKLVHTATTSEGPP